MSARSARRLAWGLFGLMVGLSIAAFVVNSVNPDLPSYEMLYTAVAVGSLGLPYTFVGALIASRFPRNAIGWIFITVGMLQPLGAAAFGYAHLALLGRPGSLPAGDVAAWISGWTWIPSISLLVTFLLLLFPDGRLPSPRWRWAAWVAGVGVGLTTGIGAIALWFRRGPSIITGNTLESDGILAALEMVGFLLTLVAAIASAVALAQRFRRSGGEERQQLKWFSFAGAYAVTAIAIQFLPGIEDGPAWIEALMVLGFVVVPVAAGIAIMKYRLYDIDVVISKTVVYGALAAFITAVYVAIVVGIGVVIGGGEEPNIALSILATAVVAVAFQPARARLQRFANRLIYGERATPYEVMAGFGRRMGTALEIEGVLPAMAEAAARGVGAARGRVRLVLPDGTERTEAWPQDAVPGPPSRSVEVMHQGERLGWIEVWKPRGEPITPSEGRLLDDLASQAGLALGNVRLTLELQARARELDVQADALRQSSQRLVTARDEQRRRLEREIRSGVERRLLDIEHELGDIVDIVEVNTDGAVEGLVHLGLRTNETLDVLRDLARGIFPPLLADKGLAPALEAHLRKRESTAELEVAPPDLPQTRFPREVETAVYFCCLQALQNAERHASGAGVRIRLSFDGDEVAFAVSDDGPGFDPGRAPEGMGLAIMRDRVEALGGRFLIETAAGAGTTVSGAIPLSVPAGLARR